MTVTLSKYTKGVAELIRDTIREDATLWGTLFSSGTAQAVNKVFVGRTINQRGRFSKPRFIVQLVEGNPDRVGGNPDGIALRESQFQITFWIDKDNSNGTNSLGWSMPYEVADRIVELFDQKQYDYDFGRGTMRAFDINHDDDPDMENTTISQIKIETQATGG